MKKKVSRWFKCIVGLSAMLCFLPTAVAGGPETPPPPSFDGLYLVGGVDAASIRTIDTYLELRNGANPSYYGEKIALSESPTRWAASARVGLELGRVYPIGDPTSGIYFGFNVNFLTGLDNSRRFSVRARSPAAVPVFDNYVYHVEQTINYTVNGLFKLGYARNNFLLYLQAGAAGANVTFATFPPLPTGIRAASYRWIPGYAGGVGLEMLLSPRFVLGADYLFSYYASSSAYSIVGGQAAGPDLGGWLYGRFCTNRVGLYLRYKLNL